MKIEVAKKRSTQRDNQRSAPVQSNRGRTKMGQNTSGYNVAAFATNYRKRDKMVYSTDVQTGEDDRVAYIETTLSSSYGSEDQRIRIVGYFDQRGDHIYQRCGQ